MTGPFPKGSQTSSILPRRRRNWGHLEPGHRYVVVKEFLDNGKSLHPVGESWTFLGYNYHQMDEGLSLYVSLDGEQEWYLPLQGGADREGEVMDYLENYIHEIA